MYVININIIIIIIVMIIINVLIFIISLIYLSGSSLPPPADQQARRCQVTFATLSWQNYFKNMSWQNYFKNMSWQNYFKNIGWQPIQKYFNKIPMLALSHRHIPFEQLRHFRSSSRWSIIISIKQCRVSISERSSDQVYLLWICFFNVHQIQSPKWFFNPPCH